MNLLLALSGAVAVAVLIWWKVRTVRVWLAVLVAGLVLAVAAQVGVEVTRPTPVQAAGCATWAEFRALPVTGKWWNSAWTRERVRYYFGPERVVKATYRRVGWRKIRTTWVVYRGCDGRHLAKVKFVGWQRHPQVAVKKWWYLR